MTHYIPSNKKDEKEILDSIGVSTFEDLIKIIPKDLRVKEGILGLEDGSSELELAQFIDSNNNDTQKMCFSGGGVYDHYVPKIIDFIAAIRRLFLYCG